MLTLLEGGPLLDELNTLPCKGRLTKGDNESWTVILDSSWDEVIFGKEILEMCEGQYGDNVFVDQGYMTAGSWRSLLKLQEDDAYIGWFPPTSNLGPHITLGSFDDEDDDELVEDRKVSFTLTDIYALETSWMMPLNLPNHRVDHNGCREYPTVWIYLGVEWSDFTPPTQYPPRIAIYCYGLRNVPESLVKHLMDNYDPRTGESKNDNFGRNSGHARNVRPTSMMQEHLPPSLIVEGVNDTVDGLYGIAIQLGSRSYWRKLESDLVLRWSTSRARWQLENVGVNFVWAYRSNCSESHPGFGDPNKQQWFFNTRGGGFQRQNAMLVSPSDEVIELDEDEDLDPSSGNDDDFFAGMDLHLSDDSSFEEMDDDDLNNIQVEKAARKMSAIGKLTPGTPTHEKNQLSLPNGQIIGLIPDKSLTLTLQMPTAKKKAEGASDQAMVDPYCLLRDIRRQVSTQLKVPIGNIDLLKNGADLPMTLDNNTLSVLEFQDFDVLTVFIRGEFEASDRDHTEMVRTFQKNLTLRGPASLLNTPATALPFQWPENGPNKTARYIQDEKWYENQYIMILIFGCLDIEKELPNLSLVCRKWSVFVHAPGAWQSISITPNRIHQLAKPYPNIAQRFTKHESIVEHLTESGFRDVKLVRLNLEGFHHACYIGDVIHVLYTLCGLSKVKCLHIDALNVADNSMLLQDLSPPLSYMLTKYADTLEILRIRRVDCAMEFLVPLYNTVKFPNLSHLVYRKADWIPLWKQMPELNSISLSPDQGAEFVTNLGDRYYPGNSKDVRMIGNNCPRIISISLDCTLLKDVNTDEPFDIFEFLSFYPQLVYLEIKSYRVDEMSDFVAKLVTHVPSLQILSLCDVSNFGDVHCQQIAENMNFLQAMYFEPGTVTATGIGYLQRKGCIYTDRWKLSRYFH